MLPLTLILHIFIGSTLSGSAVIAALASGYDSLTPILIAATAGFVASVPLSWYVARRLTQKR